MPHELCAHCAARDAALDYFQTNIKNGQVGDFIDGTLAAVGLVVAAHVLPGRAADELVLLQGKIGEFFQIGLMEVAANVTQPAALQ